MDLIDELRMLAEDLYVNGYNRYSAAMSKAADELDKWEACFGHLGGTPDECGNAAAHERDNLRAEVESWKGLAAQFGKEADKAKTHLAFAKDNLNQLRAKIKAMEQQEPVAWRTPKTEGMPR